MTPNPGDSDGAAPAESAVPVPDIGVVAVVADELHWDATRREAELATVARDTETRLAWRNQHERAA